MIFDKHANLKYKFGNRHFWAEGYYVSTVGLVFKWNGTQKVEKVGLITMKSEFVNSPIINKLPLTLECELIKSLDQMSLRRIVNVSAEEHILDQDGKIDMEQFSPITYDTVNLRYYRLGECVETAEHRIRKIIPHPATIFLSLISLSIWMKAAVMYLFFDGYDFFGKTINSFTPHGGIRLSGTSEMIAELEPDAVVSDNAFTVSRNDVEGTASDVAGWIDSLNLGQ